MVNNEQVLKNTGGRKIIFWLGLVLLFVLIVVIILLFFTKEDVATYALSIDDYECPEGTQIFEYNGKFVCYVRTGIETKCPMDKEQSSVTSQLDGVCNLEVNDKLTAIRGTEVQFYMPDTVNLKDGDLRQACYDRNYVQTADDDTEYYGYYKTACVCYGSFENNIQCGSRQWLNKELSDEDYRYYISAESADDISCTVGEAIVIDTDIQKGDLYACSTSDATLKKYKVNLILNPSNVATADVVSKEVEVASDAIFQITPSVGYEYVSNDCGGIYDKESNSFTVSEVLADKTCTVNFQKVSHKVEVVVSSDSTGNGTVNPEVQQVEYGTSSSVAIVVDNDSKYESTTCTSVGGVYNSSSSTISFDSVTEDISCEVKVVKKTQYVVKASANNDSYGQVSPESKEVYEGEASVIEVVPATGYQYGSHVCKDKESKEITSSIDTAKSNITLSDINTDVYCEVVFEPIDYTVKVVANPTGGGEVTVDKSVVNYGESIEVDVVPSEGYSYTSNTCGAVVNDDGNLVIDNVTGNVNCQVNFSKNYYTVSAVVSPSDGGEAIVSSTSVEHGDSATIEISPSEGYQYKTHSCGAISSVIDTDNSTITVNDISSNVSCSIEFELIKYKVVVISNNESYGTVTLDKSEVTKDEIVNVTIESNPGYRYVSNTCGVTAISDDGRLVLSGITEDKTCQVNFEPDKYTIVAKVDSNGGGTVSPSSVTVDKGGEVTLTLVADDMYKYKSNSCGAILVGDDTLQISNIMEDKECVISYVMKDKYTISVNATGGKATAALDEVYEGGSTTIDLSPDANYEYVSNDCGAIVNSDKTKLTLANIWENKVCNVVFEEKSKYKVQVSSSNDNYGTVSPEVQNVYAGEEAKVTLEVTEGNEYLNVVCNDKEVTEAVLVGKELTIPNIVENKVCVVNYKDVGEYTVTASSNNDTYGKVSPDVQTVVNGGTAVIVLVPSEGYKYKANDCGAVLSSEGQLELEGITSNRKCVVTFEKKNKYTIEAFPSDEGGGIVVVDKEEVYEGEDTAILVVPNEGYEYETNDCGGVYEEGYLVLDNVVSSKVCIVSFKSSIFKTELDETEEVSNVQTGIKENIIVILLMMSLVLVIVSYKKIVR